MHDFSNPEAAARSMRTRLQKFSTDAHKILGRFETAGDSRIISVNESRKPVQGLSIQQEGLFTEALDCISYGLFRAAHVSAWQAFMDSLDQKLASDGLVKLRSARPRWPQSGSIEELRDEIGEYQRIEVAKALGLLDKASMKSLHGMLSTRNACAHSTGYKPGLNASLGYVSDLIDRVGALQRKSL